MIYTLFLSGIYTATFAASGLIFFKFFRASRDRFFLYFSLACWGLAIEKVVLLFSIYPTLISSTDQSEGQVWVYMIRMVSFSIILYAIIEKNRKKQLPSK